MDKAALAEQIGSQPGGEFRIQHIAFERWGNELVISCVYEAGSESKPVEFQILLHDCREMQWRLYAHLRPPDDQTLPEAMLVNIHLGRDNHRKPLHILTDFFGLTVLYGTMEIER